MEIEFQVKDYYFQNSKHVKELENLIQISKYIQHEAEEGKGNMVWYRGINSENHPLTPSAYRKILWNYSFENEILLFNLFCQMYMPIERKSSELEYYFAMQHYGLPTRLLDWTESLLVALFFALDGWEPGTNPCIWTLFPGELNKKVIGKNTILTIGFPTEDSWDEKAKNYIPKESQELPLKPIAIIPAYSDKRIQSQKSVFTLFGAQENGFSSVTKSNHDPFQTIFNAVKKDCLLYKIIIDSNSVPKLKEDLNLLGFNAYSVFPDIEGVVKFLKTKFYIGTTLPLKTK